MLNIESLKIIKNNGDVIELSCVIDDLSIIQAKEFKLNNEDGQNPTDVMLSFENLNKPEKHIYSIVERKFDIQKNSYLKCRIGNEKTFGYQELIELDDKLFDIEFTCGEYIFIIRNVFRSHIDEFITFSLCTFNGDGERLA